MTLIASLACRRGRIARMAAMLWSRWTNTILSWMISRLARPVTAKLCKMATMGSVSEMFDVQFAPHPCEIVGGHGIVAVHGVTRAVLQMLEPSDEVFTAPEGVRRCARRDIAQYGRGFVQRGAIVLV